MKKFDLTSFAVSIIVVIVVLIIGLATCMFVSGMNVEADAKETYQEAVQLYEEERYAEAANQFYEIIDAAPSLFDGYSPRQYLQFCINALKVKERSWSLS